MLHHSISNPRRGFKVAPLSRANRPLTKLPAGAIVSAMNVRPFQITSTKGARKYGQVHALAATVRERKTLCGHYPDRQHGYWETIDEPVTCPRCLRFSKS